MNVTAARAKDRALASPGGAAVLAEADDGALAASALDCASANPAGDREQPTSNKSATARIDAGVYLRKGQEKAKRWRRHWNAEPHAAWGPADPTTRKGTPSSMSAARNCLSPSVSARTESLEGSLESLARRVIPAVENVKDVARVDARVVPSDFVGAPPKRFATLDVRSLGGIELLETCPFFGGQAFEHRRVQSYHFARSSALPGTHAELESRTRPGRRRGREPSRRRRLPGPSQDEIFAPYHKREAAGSDARTRVPRASAIGEV
jgi:hypothetical protein